MQVLLSSILIFVALTSALAEEFNACQCDPKAEAAWLKEELAKLKLLTPDLQAEADQVWAERIFHMVIQYSENKINYDNYLDNSMARAHEIAYFLWERGLTVSKVFVPARAVSAVTGSAVPSYAGVAVTLPSDTVFIIDPALFDRPVTRSVWEREVTAKSGSHAGSSVSTPAAQYRWPERNSPQALTWQKQELVEACQINRRQWQIQVAQPPHSAASSNDFFECNLFNY